MLSNSVCKYLYIGLRQQQIGELDENDNLVISSKEHPLFAGKQSTSTCTSLAGLPVEVCGRWTGQLIL